MQNNNFTTYYEYLESGNEKLFTAFLLPKKEGKFPIVIIRSPYEGLLEKKSEDKALAEYTVQYYELLKNGYAVVIQHSVGSSKSSGEFIPYIYEREDGINLQNYIRQQSFYGGELFLKGSSYLTSVHYATAPYDDDIKGAFFAYQDCERYNICYRNGALKLALHTDWYVKMYKEKSRLKKNYIPTESANILPFSKFSETVLGEKAEDFDEIIKHPLRDDPFWNTRYGGSDARDAVKNAKFPMLFTTGFYDIYTGGIFDMWKTLNADAKQKSALIVDAYDHGGGKLDIIFPGGFTGHRFGLNLDVLWFNYLRGKVDNLPFETGKVTYYNLFENVWKTDDFKSSGTMKLTFGEESYTYTYNPYAPPKFKGGLSCNFGGSEFQDKPNSRPDIISVYSEPFMEETYVKGKMSAKLSVKSDCEDTGFYVRLSITKEDKDYGLRDDITSLCFQHPDYLPGSEVDLDFNFDEHAFLIKKGERIRMDIASADAAHYVRHTNNKGLFSEQETAKIAHNTVNLKESYLIIPIV